MEEKFIIKNNLDEIPILADKIEKLIGRWELPSHYVMNINLAMEEAVSNIIFYAFSDNKDHDIQININLKNNQLTITIEDKGKPFDPSAVANPDINLTAEDRPIGGLGIFLIRKIMDEVSYLRADGKNILKITKKIER